MPLFRIRRSPCVACLLLLLTAGIPLALPAQPNPVSPSEIITNAVAIRNLTPAQAAAGLRVRLSATVTALNPGSPAIFIQDNTGGTFIRVFQSWPSDIEPGDVVEVTGLTFPGRFVPGIDQAFIKIVGHSELPPPADVTYDDLLSGRFHYERVQIQGIIRSFELNREPEPALLTVALGTRKLQLRVVAPAADKLPPLVDAEVRIAGLASGYINDIHQLVTPQLLVSRVQDIHVITPPPANPLPLSTASSLLSFDPKGLSGHRVRVRGLVTHHQPGKALFLRDDEQRGLFVHAAKGEPAYPGDVVEVVGFPAMGKFSAFLDDAEFRKVGSSFRPEPKPVSMQEALRGTNDANLVVVEAQLLEILHTSAESVLVLRAADTALRARVASLPAALRPGSKLRLTGICRVEELEFPQNVFGATPGSIELLIRSPADIYVHSAASWWTARRLAILAGLVLLLALAAISRVLLLRRRVAVQSEVIRTRLQREAALEERHRVAREIHDTVAQSFSGLGFQLDALSARLPAEADDARKQLDTARQIVRHSQESFRRSLMNLRAQELERGRLDQALPELARQITAGTGIDLRFQIDASHPGLPEPVENNLLRIGQECLTNAVHHANPTRIELTISFQNGHVQMRIADNGSGFDTAQLDQPLNGHFGWPGIRERAEQIRAKIKLDSAPGRGTDIRITVPV